jgi:hypothetical protein
VTWRNYGRAVLTVVLISTWVRFTIGETSLPWLIGIWTPLVAAASLLDLTTKARSRDDRQKEEA